MVLLLGQLIHFPPKKSQEVALSFAMNDVQIGKEYAPLHDDIVNNISLK